MMAAWLAWGIVVKAEAAFDFGLLGFGLSLKGIKAVIRRLVV